MGKYKLLLDIPLKEFPTHLPRTDNKTKANKMWKVNGQAIYSKALNEFARAIVVTNAHNYIINEITKIGHNNLFLKGKMVIVYEITTVYNHGSISLRGGKTIWKPCKPAYEPTWDIENLASFWTKVGNDALTLAGVIVDDNVRYVQGTSHIFKECKDLNERVINIKIYEYE